MSKHHHHTLQVAKLTDTALVYTNFVYVNPADLSKLSPYCTIKTSANIEYVYTVGESEAVPAGHVAFNGLQRKDLDISLRETITATRYTTSHPNYVHILKIQLTFANPRKTETRPYEVEKLQSLFTANFIDSYFAEGQQVLLDVSGISLIAQVSGVANVEMEGRKVSRRRGLLMAKTQISFDAAPGSTVKIQGESKSAAVAFGPNFNFEAMGIGGLDREFGDMFRRAFASRVYDPKIVKNLGIKHVKGMLLYGPPGTGKTLIAKKIGQLLNARKPQVVDGPSILNKFVGKSEENIRKLFEPAEQEYRERGDDSELHTIIFDEIDAICKERGSTGGGTGVGDSVVNQLLTKMDGYEDLNNILVIGMTNRKDMLDKALLRPGRLEVHIEIGLPDEKGRVQILSIHTGVMKKNNHLDANVDLAAIAADSKNFSGAELEELVKAASSYALNRGITAQSEQAEGKGLSTEASELKVTQQDFLSALAEIEPAFGASEETLSRAMPNGIIPYSDDFKEVFLTGKRAIQLAKNSSRTPLLSLLLSGLPGSGKSALAAALAKASDFPYVKFLSPNDFVGYTEQARVAKITTAFEDAYKSKHSLVIVDDIERFLDYVPIGPRFSNNILQCLLILLRKRPPPGHKLVVLATTSAPGVLKDMNLLSAINSVLHVPSLTEPEHVVSALTALGGYKKEDYEVIRSQFQGHVEINKVILMSEMAKQIRGEDKSASLGQIFLDTLNSRR